MTIELYGRYAFTHPNGPSIDGERLAVYLWKPDHDPTLDVCNCRCCRFARHFLRVDVIRQGHYLTVPYTQVKPSDTIRSVSNSAASIH